uniref:Metallo-beta-lactamase domain-containing protein 1 n=1 Tax=Coturnix japonica TaxID=93934 RepID=A0A8C2Y5I6_COTJA
APPLPSCGADPSHRGLPPYSLTIVQEGFSRPRPDGTLEADGTITLVRGGPVTALVDTGGPWGRRRLLDGLESIGVTPRDVTHVLCTHGHSDHVGNINLFPSASILLAQGVPYAPHPGLVEVVATPGHVKAHVSVLVRGTDVGTVLVAGDLFECEGDEGGWAMGAADVIVPGPWGCVQVPETPGVSSQHPKVSSDDPNGPK